MKRIIGIYKVGGGVLTSKAAIDRFVKNVKNMWPKSEDGDQVTRIFVISAFGHMTNLLQDVISASSATDLGNSIKTLAIFVKEMGLEDFEIPIRFSNDDTKINFLQKGELFSSRKIEDLFSHNGISCILWNARHIVKTESLDLFEADVDLQLTQNCFNEHVGRLQGTVTYPATIITQGFISSGAGFVPTLLGREGSDYSAALFANCARNMGIFDKVSLTFIKSTPGVSVDWHEGDEQQEFVPEITWATLIKMAKKGSKIFHPQVAKLLKGSGVSTIVTNLEYFDNDSGDSKKTLIKY